jgi:hypothetical protein
MPTVWIDRDEAVYGDLPPLCMRCGADATVTKSRVFSWHPGWVNLLILVNLLVWAVVAMVMTKKMKLKAPMCDRHAGHWFRFNLFLYGGLVGMLAVLCSAIPLFASNDPNLKDLGPVPLVVGGVGFLVVLIIAAVWQLNTIRAVEITEDDMKLKGVCEEFRQALREQRRAERDAEDDPRPRRREG